MNDFDDDIENIKENVKYRKERVLEKIKTEWVHRNQKIADIFVKLLYYQEHNELTE